MICAKCGLIFCPDQIDIGTTQANIQLYCSKECRRMAQKSRSRQRHLCAAQGKICYATAEAALQDMRVLKAHAHITLTAVYPCGLHWHTTSQPRERV